MLSKEHMVMRRKCCRMWQGVILLFFVLVGSVVTSGCGKERLIERRDGENDSYEIAGAYQEGDGGKYDFETGDKARHLEKGDVSNAKAEEKIIISMAISGSEDSSLESLVNLFNAENEEYFVDLTVHQFATLNDARLRLQTEIMAGEGPDVLSDDLFEITEEILAKGALVDLKPLLLQSGMTEEKYFPGMQKYFYKEGVYAVNLEENISGRVIDEEVLGSAQVPDMETLVDDLLSYPQKAAFYHSKQSASRIMDYFLCGSENLWGCIDWEKKKCDFSGELFSKIMEVSKKYWDNREYEPIMEECHYYAGAYVGDAGWEQKKKVRLDYYFDDGNHPIISNGMTALSINANSKNVEGAWVFLSYALSRRGQGVMTTPVHREMFRECAQTRMQILEGQYEGLVGYSRAELSEEIIRELENAYDQARYEMARTERIREIIYEEAEGYFQGIKSKEEVISVIQNRVQLYLAE